MHNILFILLELKNNTKLIKVSSAVQETTINILKPILQKWSKQKISPNGVFYGMRRYLKGAWMSLHVDRLPSHILSVILQVLDTSFPLFLWEQNNKVLVKCDIIIFTDWSKNRFKMALNCNKSWRRKKENISKSWRNVIIWKC